MCLGIPGRVVELSPDHPDIGRVDVQGTVRDINLALLEDDPARPGDWILIHLGFALQKMTAAEVKDALETMSLLGQGTAADPWDGLFSDHGVEPAQPSAAAANESHYGQGPG